MRRSRALRAVAESIALEPGAAVTAAETSDGTTVVKAPHAAVRVGMAMRMLPAGSKEVFHLLVHLSNGCVESFRIHGFAMRPRRGCTIIGHTAGRTSLNMDISDGCGVCVVPGREEHNHAPCVCELVRMCGRRHSLPARHKFPHERGDHKDNRTEGTHTKITCAARRQPCRPPSRSPCT